MIEDPFEIYLKKLSAEIKADPKGAADRLFGEKSDWTDFFENAGVLGPIENVFEHSQPSHSQISSNSQKLLYDEDLIVDLWAEYPDLVYNPASSTEAIFNKFDPIFTKLNDLESSMVIRASKINESYSSFLSKISSAFCVQELEIKNIINEIKKNVTQIRTVLADDTLKTIFLQKEAEEIQGHVIDNKTDIDSARAA